MEDKRIKQVSYKQCYCSICGKSVCETDNVGLDIYHLKLERVDKSFTDRHYQEEDLMLCGTCVDDVVCNLYKDKK